MLVSRFLLMGEAFFIIAQTGKRNSMYDLPACDTCGLSGRFRGSATRCNKIQSVRHRVVPKVVTLLVRILLWALCNNANWQLLSNLNLYKLPIRTSRIRTRYLSLFFFIPYRFTTPRDCCCRWRFTAALKEVVPGGKGLVSDAGTSCRAYPELISANSNLTPGIYNLILQVPTPNKRLGSTLGAQGESLFDILWSLGYKRNLNIYRGRGKLAPPPPYLPLGTVYGSLKVEGTLRIFT